MNLVADQTRETDALIVSPELLSHTRCHEIADVVAAELSLLLLVALEAVVHGVAVPPLLATSRAQSIKGGGCLPRQI